MLGRTQKFPSSGGASFPSPNDDAEEEDEEDEDDGEGILEGDWFGEKSWDWGAKGAAAKGCDCPEEGDSPWVGLWLWGTDDDDTEEDDW